MSSLHSLLVSSIVVLYGIIYNNIMLIGSTFYIGRVCYFVIVVEGIRFGYDSRACGKYY